MIDDIEVLDIYEKRKLKKEKKIEKKIEKKVLAKEKREALKAAVYKETFTWQFWLGILFSILLIAAGIAIMVLTK